MNQVFLDTNILLDYCLKRSDFEKNAGKVLNLVFQKKIKGYISALSYANMYYLLRKENAREKIMDFFKSLKSNFATIAVDDQVLDAAMHSAFTDFEDAIQYYCALKVNKLDAIITRNEKDYKKGSLTTLNPEEFLNIYNQRS